MMFVIEDEIHAETDEFPTREAAMSELRRRAKIPWDEQPNRAPCQSWRTCGRRYVLIEYDDSCFPWRAMSCQSMLEVSASDVIWRGDDPESR